VTRGQDHYRENIIESCPVQLFTATNQAMLEYPYVLGTPDESSPTLSRQADVYIMDSDIEDETVRNDRVLERAMDHNADWIVPADVLHDQATSTDRILDLFVRLDDVAYDPDVLVPLHPDDSAPEDVTRTHLDHYWDVRDALGDHGIDLDEKRLSIGGVADWEPVPQLEATLDVRTTVGDQHIHGLGIGPENDWFVAMRRHHIYDSLDCSSITRDLVNGTILDADLERRDYGVPRGNNSTVVSVMFREATWYLMNYLLTPQADERDIPTAYHSDAFASTIESWTEDNTAVPARA
jgi:hypothetical protein